VDKNKAGVPTDVPQEINELFQALKLRRKHKFLVFKLADDDSGNVIVEHVGDPKASANDFLALLPNSDCRFCIFDYDYKSTDGRPQSKLWFISYLPENATPHNMMAYSAAKGVFRDRFTGVFDLMAKTVEDVEVALGMRKEDAGESDGEMSDFD
jgi:cofilin